MSEEKYPLLNVFGSNPLALKFNDDNTAFAQFAMRTVRMDAAFSKNLGNVFKALHIPLKNLPNSTCAFADPHFDAYFKNLKDSFSNKPWELRGYLMAANAWPIDTSEHPGDWYAHVFSDHRRKWSSASSFIESITL
jgi:hypothetical protein